MISNENSFKIAALYSNFNTVIILPEKIYKIINEIYRVNIKNITLSIFHLYQE